MTPTEQAKAALIVAREALNCWTLTYASDMCDPERVAAAEKVVHEYGTLSYIATANKTICEAIDRLQEGVDAG